MTDQPRLVRISLLTALAPAVWGSTYLVTTEFLPPDRPLLASTLRALPAGLILLLITRVLPKGIWWIRATVLGVLNIGAFFYCLFLAAYHLPGGVAALVTAVQPLIVLLLGPLVLGARIRPCTWAPSPSPPWGSRCWSSSRTPDWTPSAWWRGSWGP